MHQPPPAPPLPPPASSVPSAPPITDQLHHPPLDQHYHHAHYALHHQGSLFPLLPSSPSSIGQFPHLYTLGGGDQFHNNINGPNHHQQQQPQQQPSCSTTTTTTTNTKPSVSEGSEKVKSEGQQQRRHHQQNGTARIATTTRVEKKDEEGAKGGEEGGKVQGADGGGEGMATVGQFPYGTNGTVPFGGMFPEYGALGDWMATGAQGQMASSYPLPPSLPHQMPPPPPCPVPLIPTDELNAMYGPNGLMIPTGLHYELEQYGGVWSTGGGYYLGSDQTKLLVDSQQYMNGSADGRYGVGGIGVEGVNASNGGQNPFYQGISPSASFVDPSLFQPASGLPPPPSQLSGASDQLYSQSVVGAFGPSLGAPSSSSSSHPSAIPPDHSALLSPQNGPAPPSLLHQLDPSGVPQQHANFYPSPQFGASIPLGNQSASAAPSNSTITTSTTSTNLGIAEKAHQSRQPKQQHKGAGNNAVPIRQNPAKRGRSSATSVRVGTSALTTMASSVGRPSTSQGIAGLEKEERMVVSRKSRSRSVVKESEDDGSTEEKEQERRNANNTRERIRVRDINAAFKELARLCCQHMPNLDERGLTKLNTLLKAVELIPVLEKKVEEKNQMMSARKDCIKHRLDDLPPMGVLGQQQFAPASSSCSSSSSCIALPLPAGSSLSSSSSSGLLLSPATLSAIQHGPNGHLGQSTTL